MAVERIYIVGGPGNGKSTLAARLAERTRLPVHHLDDVARVGGGRGPERSAEERAAAIARIVASGRWIAEGVQIGWTAALIDAAQVIVWLDHLPWQRSSRRIVGRFVSQALAEARRRRGRQRYLRLRDYARRLHELAVSVPETRSFPSGQLESVLEAAGDRVIHCRTAAEVAAAERLITGG